MTAASDTTRLSLLLRLRTEPHDSNTWNEFVDRYGSMIRRWCLRWGLQEADADDVAQHVLLALSKQMRDFEYQVDGRFRAWLKVISYRAWCQFLERRKRARLVSGCEEMDQMLQSIEARDDFVLQMDRECERNMLEDAMRLVEARVHPRTWLAFRQTAFEKIPGEVVAKSLEMSVLAVYRAKSRVQAMIQEEIQRMDND